MVSNYQIKISLQFFIQSYQKEEAMKKRKGKKLKKDLQIGKDNGAYKN